MQWSRSKLAILAIVSLLCLGVTIDYDLIGPVFGFTSAAGDKPCAAGEYKLFANSSIPGIRQCVNGTISTVGGGGGGSFSGGSVDTTIDVTSKGMYFSAVVTGQAWVTANSEILCSPFGTTADGLTPETVAVAAPRVIASDRVVGTGFTIHVTNPYGLEGTLRVHCIGI